MSTDTTMLTESQAEWLERHDARLSIESNRDNEPVIAIDIGIRRWCFTGKAPLQPTVDELIAHVERSFAAERRLTDDGALAKLDAIAQDVCTEAEHVEADKLLCELLLSHGYEKTVARYRAMSKWYS